MKIAKLDDMVKGWFIGNFSPTLHKTNNVEVAVKKYRAGDFEAKHFHKIATEFTVIISGSVEMNQVVYHDGTIIIIEPNDITDFKALNEVTTLVVKIPGANNDKFEAKQ